MTNTLDFNLGDPGKFAIPADDTAPDPIDAEFFGAEFLGQRFFINPSYGQEVLDQIGYHHLRWPGDHPETQAWHDHDNDDATPDSLIQKYGLTFENFVNPEYTRGNGDAREGISEMFAFAVANGLSFALVAPTVRYVEMAVAAGGDAAAIVQAAQSAASDMEVFLTRLYDGEFGEIPREFTIELGSEYYATTIWQQLTSGIDTDGDGSPDPQTQDPGDLTDIFGAVFAAMAAKIDEVEDLNHHEVLIDGTAHSTDINVSVQMGRFQEDANDSIHSGDYSDNLDFINAFQAHGQEALDAVDSVIWHRYVTRWGGIENGIWDPVQTDETGAPLTVSDVVQKWEVATGRELDLLAGYSSPSLSGDKHKLEHDEQSLSYILQQTTGLLAEGADIGSLFGVGSGQYGSYAYRDSVFIGGDLWALMSESLPGKFVVETHTANGDGYRENTSPLVYDAQGEATGNTNDDTVNSYVFEDGDKVVIFLVAKDFGSAGEHGSERLDYTLNFDTEFAFGSSVSLWDSGVDYLDGSGRHIGTFGEMSEEAAVTISDANGGAQISVRFNHDYELIRLTLDKVLDGTNGDDVLNGFDTADKIVAMDGDDLLNGFAGDDTLKGGAGSDTLLGGSGQDRFDGGEGTDVVDYSSATEHVKIFLSSPGSQEGEAAGDSYTSIEEFIGTDFDDDLVGNGDKNVFTGGGGDDFLKGAGSRDTLSGGDGNDELNGGKGQDHLSGDAGHDLMSGKGGADIMFGQTGNDTLDGGSGEDTLIGGSGDDTLDGGQNPDTFVFADDHGHDTIHNFSANNNAEKIDLSAITEIDDINDILGTEGSATQIGNDVEIETGDASSILLLGVDLGDLDQNDFIF